MYIWDTEKGSLLRGVSVCRAVCTYGTQRKARCCVVYLCVGLCVHIGERERLVAAWCICVYGCVYILDTEKGSLLRGVSVCTYGTLRKARCYVISVCTAVCTYGTKRKAR